jgi:hypothetical protein
MPCGCRAWGREAEDIGVDVCDAAELYMAGIELAVGMAEGLEVAGVAVAVAVKEGVRAVCAGVKEEGEVADWDGDPEEIESTCGAVEVEGIVEIVAGVLEASREDGIEQQEIERLPR